MKPLALGARWIEPGLAAGYVALDWLSYIHPLQQSTITPWNPHPALAIALLVFRGQRAIATVFAAVLAAELLIRGAPYGWPGTLLIATVLTLGYAAMAAGLSTVAPAAAALDTRADLGRLIAVVTLGALVTGMLYIGALWASGAAIPGAYFAALLQFWIGDCVGILVMLPVILLLADSARREQLKSLVRRRVTWLQAASVAVALWLVFGPIFDAPFKFFYILFLPLIWVAVSQGLVGAAAATLAIQVGVILAVQAIQFPTLTVFELQALLIALAVTGLVLGIVVDERRRATEGLRNSLRLAAAGELSAALAHELNQPLTALTTYARAARLLLEQPHADLGRIRETLEKVVAEANRTADVVRRLREFFRTGSATLAHAALPSLVEAALHEVAPRADASEVALEHVVRSTPPGVLVDSIQIEVVLRNLLTNGVQAAAESDPPRWVRVEVGIDDAGNAYAVVHDSGHGVAAANAERVFEPFWSSRTTGMGMGLAISRAIVEAHGGRIWVESSGRGSFGFTLPAAHA